MPDLKENEIERYRTEGYLILPGLIHGEKLDAYLQLLDGLVQRVRSMLEPPRGFSFQPDEAGNPIAGRLLKVQGLCVAEPGALALAREPEIVDRVASLIGPELHVFGTKFFPMLPQGGTSTGWHQDNHYFGTDSERIVSCGIYLQDTNRSNGCLRVITGSHASKKQREHSSGEGSFAHGDWTQVDETSAALVECPPGTVVLFSANLLHGATTNRSDRSRYSTAWHYIPADLQLDKFTFGEYKDRHWVRG